MLYLVMVSRLLQKRLQKEIKLYSQDNFTFPNLILRYRENNLLKWYFIVHELEAPFKDGMYFGYILLPTNYPFNPPDFYFLTPNGKFQPEAKICTTFSSFHPETYTCTWNIMTMMEGMISHMTDESSHGVGIINTSDADKQHFAKESREWNRNNQLFNEIFPEFNLRTN